MSRRQLLLLAGMMGGTGAVYRVARALDVIPDLSEGPVLSLAKARGKRHVVILGAGVAGLVSAYELQRAGYSVEVLEASYRLGGRVLTLRHGDIVDEIGNRQVCQFDNEPHLYFNAGASRIPALHRRLLQYCKTLGVALEAHTNFNIAAWMQFDNLLGGRRVRQREYNADVRGFVAELMAKSVQDGTIETPLSAADRQKLLEFIAAQGDLGADNRYRGSSGRSGYQSGGLYNEGVPLAALPFAQLLQPTDYWHGDMDFGDGAEQSSVLQPVGGMDKIISAFAAQLPGKIQTNSQVVSVQTGEQGVKVTYRRNGALVTTTGDYCLNSIPGQILAGIDNNFSRPFREAIARRPRGKLGKIALQMRERFWEEKDGIYGGTSWTGQDIGQIQYPTHGVHARKGIVVGGYYLYAGPSERFQLMSAQERLDAAIQQGAKVHPDYASYVENGVSVGWYRMNHMLGCSARHTDASELEILRRPEGRHYLIGDQVAMHAGWQEAALLSAHDVLNQISQREAATAA